MEIVALLTKSLNGIVNVQEEGRMQDRIFAMKFVDQVMISNGMNVMMGI